MSSYSRSSRQRHKAGHAHCDSCYTRRCRTRVEPSVCCPLSTCRLLCGALFHLCKEEDHLLLCPNVRVPCINAEFGCPLQMLRSSRAEHLQFCPASVVSCSMEWLRWPVDETNPNSFVALQENLLKERNERREEALDVSLALVDQSELYSRLKMKPLYPEMMEQEEEEEEEEEERKEESAVGGTLKGEAEEEQASSLPAPVCEPVSAEEPATMSRSQMLGLIKDRSNIMDMMFGMERGACSVAESKQDDPTQKDKTREKDDDQKQATGVKGEPKDPERHETAVGPEVDRPGHAPWDQGVLERLGKDLTPQEFNMYIVHHGRMLMAFGQIEACTPRERDFVYGSLEPIPVQTLRSFKVPDSYHYRHRVHLYDTAFRAPTEARGTDTSDLDSSEDQWFSDEAKITLLGYAEREVMGHKICEMKASDGLYVDEGTQTFTFRSAPFTSKTKLCDVITDAEGLPELHLQLQAEPVNSRNNRESPFAFICGHVFHRREYHSHVRNVHSDIQTGLSGWFQQRCPLSYLGCTFSCRRFQPSTHKATVTYNQDLKTFNLRPAPVCPLWDDSEPAGEDPLSSLPYEVLCHMASFLDSLSLSQLALVSRLMRQVCSSQLQDRGMVTLRWDKTSTQRGRSQWKATPVWEFSYLFTKVDSWHFSEISPISSHLKVCPFYEQQVHSARVPLPSLSPKQKNTRENTLLNYFTENKKL